MKVTVDRKKLQEALEIAAWVTPSKTTIPALCGVRLSVNGSGTLRLAATDMEMGVLLDLARLSGGGQFAALLPADRLARYVKLSPLDTVTIEPGEGMVVGLDGKGKLVGMDPADFPAVPRPEGKPLAEIPGEALAGAFHEVGFAVSREVTRYSLTGALLDIRKGGGARLCASDGKRLAVRTVPAKTGGAAQMILPVPALALVSRLVRQRGDATVEVRLPQEKNDKGEAQEPTKALLTVGPAMIWTRLVEGRFPDYETVVPSNVETHWTMGRKALLEALPRVEQWCGDKDRAVRFRFGQGRLELFTRSQDIGEGTETIIAEGKEPFEAVFCPDYVRDYLMALPKEREKVTIHGKDRTSAAVWTAHEGHKYVLMPLTANL